MSENDCGLGPIPSSKPPYDLVPVGEDESDMVCYRVRDADAPTNGNPRRPYSLTFVIKSKQQPYYDPMMRETHYPPDVYWRIEYGNAITGAEIARIVAHMSYKGY